MNSIIFPKKKGFIASIIAGMILIYACQRTEYDLLDPESAGVFTLYNTSNGLPGNQVKAIQLDSRGNMWFTFPGYGTAKYNDSGWSYYEASNSPLLNNIVNCLAVDGSGKLIFGTSNGLSTLTTDNQWNSYVDPVSSMYVNSIKVASNGWIWIGTESQGFYVNNGSGYTKTVSAKYNSVNTIEEDIDGNIFLGTDSGLIKWNGTSYSFLSVSNGLPDNRITSLHFDSKERLWIGTRGGKTVSWIDLKGMHQLLLMTGRDSCFVKDIREDRRGNIWFATLNQGIIRYDGVIPYSFTEATGFPEDNVNCIGEDKEGNLWFGLNSKGLVKYTLPIN